MSPLCSLSKLLSVINLSLILPMQWGDEPLQVPSAWQILVLDPTNMKGELQLNETSDWYIKLLPSLFPWEGVPGSPQNFAGSIKKKNNYNKDLEFIRVNNLEKWWQLEYCTKVICLLMLPYPNEFLSFSLDE